MSTKSKQKQKRFDIEAQGRNETKTFGCVPESKVDRFYLFQTFGKKPNFLMCSNFFLAKAKCFYLFQKILNKIKTF